jgi:hypothetical protein
VTRKNKVSDNHGKSRRAVDDRVIRGPCGVPVLARACLRGAVISRDSLHLVGRVAALYTIRFFMVPLPGRIPSIRDCGQGFGSRERTVRGPENNE